MLAEVHARVCRQLHRAMPQTLALQIAIACAMRQPHDVGAFLLGERVWRRVRKTAGMLASLRITRDEWEDLCRGVPRTAVHASNAHAPSSAFTGTLGDLKAALRYTIAEAEANRRFSMPMVQDVCLLALHVDHDENTLPVVLGSFVRADERRVQALQCSLDDNTPQLVLLSDVLRRVCDVVCSIDAAQTQ